MLLENTVILNTVLVLLWIACDTVQKSFERWLVLPFQKMSSLFAIIILIWFVFSAVVFLDSVGKNKFALIRGAVFVVFWVVVLEMAISTPPRTSFSPKPGSLPSIQMQRLALRLG